MKRSIIVKKNNIPIFFLSLHMYLLLFNGTSFFNIGSRAYLYLIIIVISVVYIIGNLIKFSFPTKEKVICLILIFYSIISYFLIHKSGERGILLSSVLFFLLIFFWSSFLFDSNQIEKIESNYIVSAAILAIGIIVVRYKPYTGEMASRMTIMSVTGEFYDVNFISAFISIPTILLFDKYVTNRKSKRLLVLLILMMVSILLTGSRAALLLTGVGCICIALYRNMMSLNSFIIIPIIIACGIAIFSIMPNDMIQHYMRGFNLLEDKGRMNDWIYGLKVIAANPIFGNGLVPTKTLITELYGFTWLTAHNTFISFWAMYGLVIGSLIIYVVLIPLFRLIKYKAPLNYTIAYGAFIFSIIAIEATFSDIMIIPVLFFYSVSIYYRSIYNKNTKSRKVKISFK